VCSSDLANSVVSRSPLFDFRLVEFAFSLGNNLKIRNGETKYILRKAKRDQLPASIIKDSRKVQFSEPGAQWLRGPLKAFALSLKDNKNSRLSAFVHGRALNADIDSFFQEKQADGSAKWRLWRILSAEAWLRAYF
jgi:asparagine synthase (glutamine-hydrolysing)